MSFAPVLHSEWIKTRSLPSLGGVLALLYLVTAGFSLVGSATLGREKAADPDFDPLLTSFYGVNFGQVVAICFGALCAAAQLENNGTRVWLLAVPRRGLLYTANLAVIAGATFLVGLATGLTCVFAGQPLLDESRLTFDDPAGLRAVVGCSLYLTLMALLGAGIATLLRSRAAAIGVLIPTVLLLSFVLGDVGADSGVVAFLPDRAGRQVLVLDPVGPLDPWTGLLVTAAWSATAIWAGWQRLRRHDA